MIGDISKDIHEGIIPLQSSIKRRKPRKLPVAVSAEEFRRLIQATNFEHHKVAFLLGFSSGLRISEILSLEPRCVNIKEKKILVELGKGSKDRVVPLSKAFREIHLKFLPIGKYYSGKKSGIRSLEKGFKSAAQRAGLLQAKPTLHFHSLRHGFATQAVKQGIPIHHIRTAMGHSNISTTNIYLESNPQEALRSFEELF